MIRSGPVQILSTPLWGLGRLPGSVGMPHKVLLRARSPQLHSANATPPRADERARALKSGDFVVAKSEVPFTRLFTDQTLEQEIKVLKCQGGMVG